jgi:hypothetical protein
MKSSTVPETRITDNALSAHPLSLAQSLCIPCQTPISPPGVYPAVSKFPSIEMPAYHGVLVTIYTVMDELFLTRVTFLLKYELLVTFMRGSQCI